MFYFLDCGPKLNGLASLNAGGIILDYMPFRFWISCLIPEILAIKVGSCVKTPQILHIFGPKIL